MNLPLSRAGVDPEPIEQPGADRECDGTNIHGWDIVADSTGLLWMLVATRASHAKARPTRTPDTKAKSAPGIETDK